MNTVIQIIKWVLWALPFILFCLSLLESNLHKTERCKQIMMPLVALVYCVSVLIFLNDINNWILKIFDTLKKFVPFLSQLNVESILIYISNALIILGFIFVKKMILPMLKAIWGKSHNLIEMTAGRFYEYEEDIDKWLLKKEYGQVKSYYKGIYYAAIITSTSILILSKLYPKAMCFQTMLYPAIGMIIIGEVVNILSGITKGEFVENILGEDEESYKIANYGLLRDILRGLFDNRVLYDATMDDGLDIAINFETLDEMCSSENQTVANLGEYFRRLKENGEDIDANYAKSTLNLVQGQSTLFCNPFYKDLTHYVMFPMIKHLMKYRKCLVIMGRDSSTDDVKEWLEQGIYEYVHTDSLWKVDVLNKTSRETDIGIIKFSDLYNLEIQKNNEEFLKRVGFVFLVEPSRLLATGQMGLSLLVNYFGPNFDDVVYAACDRNCDGLVDALSHTLKTNITEVAATLKSGSMTSVMCWEADGPYMHHKIFPNISRYLGIGTEINSVAMKYQIANTSWISSDKFPVLDIKWIAGQYYKRICDYTNLPISQEAFNKAFHVNSNLWNAKVNKNSFLVVEDEFQNLFEMVRVFATRAKQQGFINVISEHYLLRDYMLDNVQTFIADPKAIPTIVADYARTERNTVLKLVMRMTETQVSEEEIKNALMISGISFEDPFVTLKELIYKHCTVNEINIRVYFREKLMEDALRTEVKKYYSIEGETEIADYAKNLKNAYYIAENEKGELYHIGAKLYGQVFQAMIPGQFLTFTGKYYEVQAITPQNGVVVRRAADHISGRKYYRQLRAVTLSEWKDDNNVGGQKNIANIQIDKGYCKIGVETEGYLEMSSYEDFKTARRVVVSGIPKRSYRNKLVMKIKLPDASEKIRYTICILLNEIFRTTYPDAHPYICAVMKVVNEDTLSDNLRDIMYTLNTEMDSDCIYIVEDSEIDLGLIDSVERNLERYFELITELLMWHDEKMHEKPEEESSEEYVPEFDSILEMNSTRKKGFLKRVWDKIKGIFSRKKKNEEVQEDAVQDQVKEESQEETTQEESLKKMLQKDCQLDIEGEDEELLMPEDEFYSWSDYQKKCFLKFGYEDFVENLDFNGVVKYFKKFGYDYNPLNQVRSGDKIIEEYEKTYNPQKSGAHFCDFCGVELIGGEYEVLKDGRERCNRCSMTALRTGEEFKEVFKTVMRNMEIFYGIKLNVAIKVRMTDAKKIAKHVGETFVATPGYDGRTLGFAQKDASGYSIYIENGSPKLAAMATIAHEITHIWQYQNWNDKEIISKYGKQNQLEVYEGMAKWVEIQYLYYLNEIAYGKRREIMTRLRNDSYGKGFIKYSEKYAFSYSQEKKRTPFEEKPPL